MRLLPTSRLQRPPATDRSGAVLILVLWIAFGLVTLSLYFAQSMSLELRGADNRSAQIEADHAAQGALRYLRYLVQNFPTNGALHDPREFAFADLPVGDARVWFIGRNLTPGTALAPTFALADEASRININTAARAILEALPRMTPQLAGAIIDWRDGDSDPETDGAEDDVYQRQRPPRRCKNAPFESVDELRLVNGMTLEVLYGEDVNLNGVLDPNENDGDLSPPYDNRDGRLEPGLLEYCTVDSRESATGADGSRRINVNTGRQQLTSLLQERFGEERAAEITRALGNNPNVRSLLEFHVRAGLTADEFSQIQREITASNATTLRGLVNVNTASEPVLAAIPGIGLDHAPTLVAFRNSNPTRLDSVAWVGEVLERDAAIQAGPYLTGSTYQVVADIAAVGHHGRGYRRIRFVLDTTASPPTLVQRQDLTPLGWALGSETRETLRLDLARLQ